MVQVAVVAVVVAGSPAWVANTLRFAKSLEAGALETVVDGAGKLAGDEALVVVDNTARAVVGETAREAVGNRAPAVVVDMAPCSSGDRRFLGDSWCAGPRHCPGPSCCILFLRCGKVCMLRCRQRGDAGSSSRSFGSYPCSCTYCSAAWALCRACFSPFRRRWGDGKMRKEEGL